MRVGLLIYGSLETVSGGYLYDRMLVQHLHRQGDEVELILLPWRNYSRHLADNLSMDLYRRLCRANLDVLLQDELNHPSLFWLNHRLRGQIGYPIIAIVHHLRCSEARPAWQNWFYRQVERRYLTSVDSFIFNSQTTRTAVENLAGRGRSFVVAYPAGDRLCPTLTDVQITDRAHQSGPLRLVFVGNLIPRKGLHLLLDALVQLPRSAWQLEVIGNLNIDPAYTRFIRRRLAVLDLAEQVILSGSLTDVALSDRLAHSHALIVPSSYEGFGIVYLEGMGFGLPAIATTAGAAAEIITHGQDGFLVPPNDPTPLAQTIDLLSHDRACLAQMSLAARRRFKAHPTWEQSMERIRQFLKGEVL